MEKLSKVENMIIGLDGKPLLMQKTGIGIYTDRLLATICSLDEQNLFKVYLPFSIAQIGKVSKRYEKKLREQHTDQVSFVGSCFPPKLRRWIWQNSRMMPVESIIGDVDIFHATNLLMPPLNKAKGILTLYDLTFALFPDYHVKGMHSYVRDTKRSADLADGIIAISEHTKQDAVTHLGIPAERIKVTLLAADERYQVINDKALVAAVSAKYGIDREYILYTGTLEPRKNIPTLVKAFYQLRKETKLPHRLVLAGKKGWMSEQIYAEVTKLGLQGDVIFTGYVSDEELPFLYNGASLFVYPSFYEGFGLPPLEAMACGCPVVTSNSSSLPEVVGDAGLMVDPDSVDDLTEAMIRVLSDSVLAVKMSSAGLVKAAGFSWGRCGRETLAIYQDVLGRG